MVVTDGDVDAGKIQREEVGEGGCYDGVASLMSVTTLLHSFLPICILQIWCECISMLIKTMNCIEMYPRKSR